MALCPPVLVSTFPEGTVNQGHGSGPGAPRAPLPLLGGLTGPAVLWRHVFPEPVHRCSRKTPIPFADLASRAPVSGRLFGKETQLSLAQGN